MSDTYIHSVISDIYLHDTCLHDTIVITDHPYEHGNDTTAITDHPNKIGITDNPNHSNEYPIDTDIDTKLNRTIIVDPSFCGENYLLLKNVKVLRMEDPFRSLKIITISPGPFNHLEVEDNISISEDLEDILMYRNSCLVFDDMLDTHRN